MGLVCCTLGKDQQRMGTGTDGTTGVYPQARSRDEGSDELLVSKGLVGGVNGTLERIWKVFVHSRGSGRGLDLGSDLSLM